MSRTRKLRTHGAGAGLCYVAAVFVLNVALQHENGSVVGPSVCCEPIFVMLRGMLFFGERGLRPAVVLAGLTVVCCVVLLSV